MNEYEGQTDPSDNPYEAPQTPGGPPPIPEAGIASGDERMWAMLCHLSTFAGFVIPFGNIIGPLVIWLVKKEQYSLVDDQGKEALNFQISMTIYYIIAGISFLCFVGIVLLPVLLIFDIVITVVACLKANSGERYRYPITIRLVT